MSLIVHVKIPGAIVAASDCRITGTEQLFVPAQKKRNEETGREDLVFGKPEDIHPDKKRENEENSNVVQIPFGHYDFVNTDTEQKTFLIKNHTGCYAISYCGNANLLASGEISLPRVR